MGRPRGPWRRLGAGRVAGNTRTRASASATGAGGGEFACGARKNRRREQVAAAMDDGLGYYDELLF